MNIGTKKDNRALNEQVNNLLNATANIFKETITLIKDFEEFKFPNKNEQISNLRQLRLMKSKCIEVGIYGLQFFWSLPLHYLKSLNGFGFLQSEKGF